MKRPTEYPHPALAVDVVCLCIQDGAVQCLLMPRDDAAEVGGDWALPGGFVRQGDSLEATLARVLAEKVGLGRVHAEQLATYSALDRDPRDHVVSVTYLAIAEAASFAEPVARGLRLARIAVDWPGETGGPARALSGDAVLRLAFDHGAILGDVIKRLRGKLDYAPTGFGFLPPRFTLRDAQEVHEAILGHALNKPAFRRKLLDRHALQATGAFETGGAYRPAELYEVKEKE
ncbi:MAG: NUDIX domain-containing protein [Pseudomonadota bacterium]